MKQHKKIYISIAVVVAIFLSSCAKDYGNLNNPTAQQFLANASKSELNNLVSGTESGLRNNLNVYLDDIGTIGREGYRFSGSEPRYVTDLLGDNESTLGGSNFYITNPWTSRYRVIKNCNLLIEAANNSTLIPDVEKRGYVGFATTIKAYQLLLNLNLTYANGIRVNVSDPENLGPIVGYEEGLSTIAALLDEGKLVGLLGGDHSTPFGYWKAIAEKHGDFGILQIDAHCDLREAYENFKYSHASVMYNALTEIPQIVKLVQVGVRDYSVSEAEYIANSNNRVVTYFDKQIKERLYEGETWKVIVDEIVNHLPDKIFISFDIDGLDPKLCPHTGTPVQGGFETEQIFYLFKKVLQSGRRIIGFDLNEVGISADEWDENVGARVLFKLCNLMVADHSFANAKV